FKSVGGRASQRHSGTSRPAPNSLERDRRWCAPQRQEYVEEMDALESVAPAFVRMAHQIVWATAATVNAAGAPTTRILHPIWEWDGTSLNGWIATSPSSPKAKHLERVPMLSLTYWR